MEHHKFIAKVYCNEEEIARKTGDNSDLLYAWMMTQVEGNFGDVHGKLVDLETKKVIKVFRKADIE